ncbi:hypothetical protein TIFTF001_010226 [Ficus carica]|uniref:C2H2-type domain-containing protein n=1 Tax=Ficus carica TaxID=3494 RepID=A0AA88D4A8_FICCA|nr:hypothetical protein TIFTF001_010226 [Ficus carica]
MPGKSSSVNKIDTKMKFCKICDKSYPSGKALGGHMRSHLAKHSIPPKKPIQPDSVSASPSSSSSLINPQKSEPSREEYSMESDLSESESRRSVTRRRSKRLRRSVDDEKKVRSAEVTVSETCSDEDAAWLLVQLSKDKWDKVGSKQKREVQVEELPKFKCEACNKEFDSYQALGGHKANHKRMMINNEISEDEGDDEEEEEEEDYESTYEEEEEGKKLRGNNNYVVVGDLPPKRSFKCQFCPKEFESGQALGGHKKVHYSTTVPVRARVSSAKHGLIIDLNIPAATNGGF